MESNDQFEKPAFSSQHTLRTAQELLQCILLNIDVILITAPLHEMKTCRCLDGTCTFFPAIELGFMFLNFMTCTRIYNKMSFLNVFGHLVFLMASGTKVVCTRSKTNVSAVGEIGILQLEMHYEE